MNRFVVFILGFLTAFLLIAGGGYFVLRNKVSMTSEDSGPLLKSDTSGPVVASSIKEIDKASYQKMVSTFSKPTLINYWASWCQPCKKEIPLVFQYCKEHNIDLVFISADRNSELQKSKMIPVMNKLNMASTFIISESSVTDLTNRDAMTEFSRSVGLHFKDSGIPYFAFYQPNGILKGEFNGFSIEKAFTEYFDSKLAPLK